MWLFFWGLPDDAADIGLTEERIETLAESRLRVARLYDAAALHVYHSPYLEINVNINVSENRRSGTFNIRVSFEKYLFDAVSGRNWPTSSWETGSYGTHGGNADYILQSVSEKIDRFILEYLRVNETACQ